MGQNDGTDGNGELVLPGTPDGFQMTGGGVLAPEGICDASGAVVRHDELPLVHQPDVEIEVVGESALADLGSVEEECGTPNPRDRQ